MAQSPCDRLAEGHFRDTCLGLTKISLRKRRGYLTLWGFSPEEIEEITGAEPTPRTEPTPPSIPGIGKGLGDRVEEALTAVGVTKERVERFLGVPCNCEERKAKLNQLSAWATRVLKGAKDNAVEYLNKIIGGDEPDGQE